MSFRLNPFTGQLDTIESQSPDVAATIVTREAAENISALRMVIVNAGSTVELANSDQSFEDAKTIGMTLTAVTTGNQVRIVTFGIIEDASFVFSPNDQLYLNQDGNITTTPPSLPGDVYNVFIGQALGSGEIFINVQEPIAL